MTLKTPKAFLKEALPLTILRFNVNDPIVNLSGESWSLTLMCPWTVDRPGTRFSWESDNLEEKIQGLIGLRITGFESDNDQLIDPIFILDDGSRIHIFADTDFDPWTMGLPEMMLIGESRK
ncbi:hypothetical protein [Arthrobacter sp. R4-81]